MRPALSLLHAGTCRALSSQAAKSSTAGATAAAWAALSTAAKLGRLTAAGIHTTVVQAARLLDAAASSSWGRAASLQLRSQAANHGTVLSLLAAAAATWLAYLTGVYLAPLLWVDADTTGARLRILAASLATVAAAAAWLHSRSRINPDRVYTLTMLRLNAHPGVLEVLGAPLTGGSVRACVHTVGGWYVRDVGLRRQPPRLQMMFAVQGPQGGGVVALDAARLRGSYRFRALAVDVDGGGSGGSAPGRVMVAGDAESLGRALALSEMREPFLKALSAQRQLQQQVHDELDAQMGHYFDTRGAEEGAAGASSVLLERLRHLGRSAWRAAQRRGWVSQAANGDAASIGGSRAAGGGGGAGAHSAGAAAASSGGAAAADAPLVAGQVGGAAEAAPALVGGGGGGGTAGSAARGAPSAPSEGGSGGGRAWLSRLLRGGGIGDSSGTAAGDVRSSTASSAAPPSAR